MRIIKFIFFINFITLFIINLIKKNLTIGKAWADIHVNSLIGTQKMIESSMIQSILDISFTQEQADRIILRGSSGNTINAVIAHTTELYPCIDHITKIAARNGIPRNLKG